MSLAAKVGFCSMLSVVFAASATAAEATPAGTVPGQVKGIKALPDKAPDCTSLKNIV